MYSTNTYSRRPSTRKNYSKRTHSPLLQKGYRLIAQDANDCRTLSPRITLDTTWSTGFSTFRASSSEVQSIKYKELGGLTFLPTCRPKLLILRTMSFFNFFTGVFLLSSSILVQAGVTQKDFSGVGHIFVLNSSDWKTASPEQKVGCLDNDGRFINEKSLEECGTYYRLNDYPYTLSSKEGNCTFDDENTVANTDSYYGKRDHAWTCNATYTAVIYDELYTIVSRPYPSLARSL